MTTFEQKYLKYKTKYLALKDNINININQNGGTKNLLEINNLTDTPVFINNSQTGGSNNILDVTN